MEINTSSWHYKFLYFIRGDSYAMPINLCNYFWTLVLNFTFSLGLVSVLYILPIYFTIAHQSIINFFFMVSVIIHLIVLIMILCVKTSVWLNSGSSHNIVMEYIKAKKQKICPIIKYKD